MPTDHVQDTLERFLTDRLKVALAADDLIYESGRVNSLFAMQLVLFIEKEFGIAVDSDDLDMKNFESIAAIARLVARRRART